MTPESPATSYAIELPSAVDFGVLAFPRQREILVEVMMHCLSESEQFRWFVPVGKLLAGLKFLEKARLYPFRSAIGLIAWVARSRSYPVPDVPQAELLGWSQEARLLFLYYMSERLRYDFNFMALHCLLTEEQWAAALVEGDAALGAMRAYAALGQGRVEGLRLWQEVRERHASSPQADERVSSILLHGMWFGTKVPGQAKLMIEVADELFHTGYSHHSIHYRKAYALRLARCFDQAIDSIDMAVHGLKPGEPGFLNIHQDYTRERDLIVGAMQVEASANRLLEEANSQIAVKLEKAQQLVSDSMIKLVEILGLFIAIATVIVTSGSVFKADMPGSEKIQLFVYLTAGLLIFFILLRLVIHAGRRKL